ncbi:hypothetical protein [Rhodoblastus acidophilus]|uniref:hypothetical protein n=1 Tax=Rhodoblastus acidophilus TaxID=1074 RepID=UPI002223FF57|nr:hypothetical protein [Rhodoblastus acidophilus]MCW2284516.1 hypothetical protein [Rhodoblastus acidophilus]
MLRPSRCSIARDAVSEFVTLFKIFNFEHFESESAMPKPAFQPGMIVLSMPLEFATPSESPPLRGCDFFNFGAFRLRRLRAGRAASWT